MKTKIREIVKSKDNEIINSVIGSRTEKLSIDFLMNLLQQEGDMLENDNKLQ